jgi:hypothetical protein
MDKTKSGGLNNQKMTTKTARMSPGQNNRHKRAEEGAMGKTDPHHVRGNDAQGQNNRLIMVRETTTEPEQAAIQRS